MAYTEMFEISSRVSEEQIERASVLRASLISEGV